MAPLISVLMPVYNCENYVYQAIESILNQTEGNFELLVIDDASTDGTVQVINTIADDRLQLITKTKNTGYTHSLNMGLALAKGKYIARMDGDDISLPTRFQKQLAAFSENPKLIVCGTWFSLFGAEERNIEHPTDNAEIQMALLRYCCVGHPTVMINRERVGVDDLIYDPTEEPAEDYNLWTRLIAKGEFCNIPEVLLHYRIHASSVSKTRVAAQEASATKAQLRMLGYAKSLTPNEKRIIEDCLFLNKRSSITTIRTLLHCVAAMDKPDDFFIYKDKFKNTLVYQSNAFCRQHIKNNSVPVLEKIQVTAVLFASPLFSLKRKLSCLKLLITILFSRLFP